MSTNNTPDIDPSNNESLIGTLQFVFGKMMQGVNGMLPAKVIKFDRPSNRVQVQLLIAIVTTGGAQIARPQIASLPVFMLGGGNFLLNFPIAEGDLGWVIANDRDISIFLQTYQQSSPNTGRVKNFADGVFIPNIMKDYTISHPADDGKAVLQNLSGSVKITLGTDEIELIAPNVTVNAVTATVTGSTEVDVTAPTVTVTAPVRLNLTSPEVLVTSALLAATGNITATGTITPGTPPPP